MIFILFILVAIAFCLLVENKAEIKATWILNEALNNFFFSSALQMALLKGTGNKHSDIYTQTWNRLLLFLN